MIPQENLPLDRYDYAIGQLEKLTPHLPSSRVYDIGPGDGRLRERVKGLGLEWHGFDRQAWGDVESWNLDQPGAPAVPLAGAILLLDVIEHCPSPGLALQSIASAMLSGGRLIVTTPNPAWSAGRLHMLVRGQAAGFTRRDLAENHHLFPIWPHVMSRLLEYAEFVVEEFVTIDGRTKLTGRSGRLGGLSRLGLNLTQIAIEHLDKSARGMSYAMIARRR